MDRRGFTDGPRLNSRWGAALGDEGSLFHGGAGAERRPRPWAVPSPGSARPPSRRPDARGRGWLTAPAQALVKEAVRPAPPEAGPGFREVPRGRRGPAARSEPRFSAPRLSVRPSVRPGPLPDACRARRPAGPRGGGGRRRAPSLAGLRGVAALGVNASPDVRGAGLERGQVSCSTRFPQDDCPQVHLHPRPLQGSVHPPCPALAPSRSPVTSVSPVPKGTVLFLSLAAPRQHVAQVTGRSFQNHFLLWVSEPPPLLHWPLAPLLAPLRTLTSDGPCGSVLSLPHTGGCSLPVALMLSPCDWPVPPTWTADSQTQLLPLQVPPLFLPHPPPRASNPKSVWDLDSLSRPQHQSSSNSVSAASKRVCHLHVPPLPPWPPWSKPPPSRAAKKPVGPTSSPGILPHPTPCSQRDLGEPSQEPTVPTQSPDGSRSPARGPASPPASPLLTPRPSAPAPPPPGCQAPPRRALSWKLFLSAV
ncbi:proline-rich protein 36-like [Camelus ferus]|uniref:Proline-rich protein 36-like n=1 Tax=Camelus ferus TaxID=419612 RepID=A0A8B8RG45_CAMFR|nr:proline-rich protein 36-like [Camelus ferus]